MSTTSRLATAARLGGAAKWRLAQSLTAMERAPGVAGARLDVLRGEADAAILALAAAANAGRVLWTRRYEGEAIALDARVKAALRERGVEALSFNGRLMREPWELAKADGAPPGVFSAFWRRHRALGPCPRRRRAPERLTRRALARGRSGARRDRSACALRRPNPTGPASSRSARPRAKRARSPRSHALSHGALAGYADERDLTSRETTSRLSAHLRFGEISTRRIARAVESAAAARPVLRRDAEKFMAELGWRDFAAALLYAHPDLATRPLRPEFERFPWRDDEAGFRAWARGRTGYPIVDAGMRQLWRTGFMHNRVRMIAASFLVKHLLIDWRRGEAWFWDTLTDADPASNPMNWQWVAGSARTPRPISASSIRCCRRKSSTPTAPMCAAGCPSLRSLDGARDPCALAGFERSAGARRRRPGQDLSAPDRRPRRGPRPGARSLRRNARARGLNARLKHEQLLHQREHFLVGQLGCAGDGEWH